MTIERNSEVDLKEFSIAVARAAEFRFFHRAAKAAAIGRIV
jgi:hypothetical protein